MTLSFLPLSIAIAFVASPAKAAPIRVDADGGCFLAAPTLDAEGHNHCGGNDAVGDLHCAAKWGL